MINGGQSYQHIKTNCIVCYSIFEIFVLRVDYPCTVTTSKEKNIRIIGAVEAWFSKSARDFPWRRKSTPWGRLVSEFMAQQTQIGRVADRWPSMMKQFPTPKSMSLQDEQEVLKHWQGLGYYKRAKQLKATANMIVKEFNGTVPGAVESLMKLPGVGRYTAGAVASIAFNERVPIVDGNVHRVLCRLANKKNTPSPCAWSWDRSERLVKMADRPDHFNEGLMELGATVCLPRSPNCKMCPLKNDCLAFEKGVQTSVPASTKRTPRKLLHHHAVVLTCKGEYAFEQRDETGIWASMWQVPTVESSSRMAAVQVARQLGIHESIELIGSFKHILTHRIVEFQVFACEVERDKRFQWHALDSIDRIPLASAQRKVLDVHCGT